MFIKFVILLALSLFSLETKAQDPSAFVIRDNVEYVVLAPETWYYSDTVYHDLDEIVNNPGKYIFKNTNAPLAFSIGYTKRYYWFRFTLTNRNQHANNYKLLIGKISLHHLEVFASKNSQTIPLGITGINYPFNQRPYPFCYFTYPVDIAQNETISYYTFIDNRNYDLQAGFFLYSDKNFKDFEQRTYFIFGIICGIFLFVFAFNLLLYLFTRDTLHVWYAFYIVISVWQILSYEGIDYQYIFPNCPGIMSVSRSLTTQLCFFAVLGLMPRYINQQKSNSRYYNITNIIKWTMLLFTIGFVFFTIRFNSYSVNYFFGIGVKVLYLLALIILITSCIEQYRKGTKVALFFLVGLMIYIFGLMDYILFMLKVTDSIFKFPSLFQIFSVLEVIILSYGILYRYNSYRKEKNKLAQIVADSKLELSHQLIQTQEAERKRIAQDLHDELGSSLAALKLRLQKSSMPNLELEGILYVVDKASSDARNISHNLMPPEFEKTMLTELLANYYLKLSMESNIKFEFHNSGNNQHFTKEDELVIYRIIMELTGNILKHSHADEATVQMIYSEKYLDIMAEDNGKGIDMNETGGIGLRNIQSRVTYLKGQMHIDSNMNGTTIIIKIPYKTI